MMKDQSKKKLLLKKRTVSFLSENQMDKVLGATGDECYSATCPGDQGCPDTDADCPTSTCPDTAAECNTSNVTCPPDPDPSTNDSSCYPKDDRTKEKTVCYGPCWSISFA